MSIIVLFVVCRNKNTICVNYCRVCGTLLYKHNLCQLLYCLWYVVIQTQFVSIIVLFVVCYNTNTICVNYCMVCGML